MDETFSLLGDHHLNLHCLLPAIFEDQFFTIDVVNEACLQIVDRFFDEDRQVDALPDQIDPKRGTMHEVLEADSDERCPTPYLCGFVVDREFESGVPSDTAPLLEF